MTLSRWTLRKLSEALSKLGVYVSHQPVRRILIKKGISSKKSKSYIQSPVSLYVVKKEMIYKIKEKVIAQYIRPCYNKAWGCEEEAKGFLRAKGILKTFKRYPY